MDNGKKNALAQITAVANNRYNNLVTGNTRSKLYKLLSSKFASSNYAGASKDIDRIVLTYVKESGHELMLELISNIREMNDKSQDSLIILNEISQYDQANIIKKSLKSFKFNKKASIQVPHELKVLFDSEKINIEDIQKHEKEIKTTCNLTDDFFIKAVQSISQFKNYGMATNNQGSQYQTQQINNDFTQSQQVFNPYQNLPISSSYQTVLPPAQDPNILRASNPIYSSDKIPIVSPTQIPTATCPNFSNGLPQYYYCNPPFQPPPPYPGPS